MSLVKRAAITLISLLWLLAFAACQGNNVVQENVSPTAATATVRVSIESPSSQMATSIQKAATIAAIATMTVDVKNGAAFIITGQALTNSGGVWSATLSGLPTAQTLTFIVHAYDASSVEIFTGTTLQTLTGSGDSVSILMAPASSGGSATLPSITHIAYSSQIPVSSSATVSVSIQGASGDTLSYAFTAASGGGSFSPASGSITLVGTTGTIVSSYSAPASAGTYTHSITVANSQGNAIALSFSTLVITAASNPPVSIQFTPVITSLVGQRSGSNVTFTATVSDPGPVTYLWAFSGGLSFTDNTTNPAVLQGYDQSKSGNLTLTVSNAFGGTTITYIISLGMFPDNVNPNNVPVPMGGTIQGQVLSLTGAVTTLTGTAGVSGSVDGPATSARFKAPYGITTDGTNLYVTDSNNNVIRKIVIATGAVTTLAGTAGTSGSADGVGAGARFKAPYGITTDGANLYVADSNNSTIRKIVIASGSVTTLAGLAGSSVSTNGTGSTARFYYPYGITTDGTNLYVTESPSDTIRKIVIASGAVSTLAGTAGTMGSSEGTGATARFCSPVDITTDGTNLYVTDSCNNTIRKIVIASGAVSTLAGTAGTSGSTDATGTSARFNFPYGITTDGTNLYVTDMSNYTVRKIVIATGDVTTLAGLAGVSGSTDATGTGARFYYPYGITTDGTSLYVADTLNDTIRKIQ